MDNAHPPVASRKCRTHVSMVATLPLRVFVPGREQDSTEQNPKGAEILGHVRSKLKGSQLLLRSNRKRQERSCWQ